ncbi:YvrJ family protein [Bacillus kexueae]|uniref:YvrJ family protein n=1 Tax=Aeribacillus kexueae TaxID=2078952 RepID=UPI001FAF7B56|nr:YvrJ family protein [Bacillus kexueae]
MGDLVMTEWMQMVNQFGFPLILSIYLLLRYEKKIERIEKVMDRLEDEWKEVK